MSATALAHEYVRTFGLRSLSRARLGTADAGRSPVGLRARHRVYGAPCGCLRSDRSVTAGADAAAADGEAGGARTRGAADQRGAGAEASTRGCGLPSSCRNLRGMLSTPTQRRRQAFVVDFFLRLFPLSVPGSGAPSTGSRPRARRSARRSSAAVSTCFTGTASDLDGPIVSTQWSVQSRPAGSSATPATPTALTTSFTPDAPGPTRSMPAP